MQADQKSRASLKEIDGSKAALDEHAITAIIDPQENIRAQFAAIVESSDDAIISKTLDGIITSWNRGAEKIFGYPAQECIGQSMLMLFPPERVAEEAEILARIKQGEKVDHFETVRVTKSGKLIDVSVTLSPMRNDQGRIIGASKIARDITGRKQMEDARRASEARYRMLFEYAPDGIVVVDSKGYYLDANASICRMLGYARDEFIGLNATDIVAPAEIPHIGEALDVIKNKSDYRREWQFRRKDGSIFAVDTIATAMPCGKLLAVIRDITERKRAAEALAESQALYHSLVDQMPAGVFRKDAEGRYAFVNSFFCRIRNSTPEQFLGKLPGELPVSEAQFFSQAASHHVQIMQTGQPIEVQDEYHGVDGRTLFFHVVKSPVFAPDGKIIGSQGVLFDVTTHKHAEDEVRRLNAELEQRVIKRTAELEAANQELEAFSYSVSHDLRAPLRAINGFAGIVLEDFGSQLPEEGKRHLERIRDGGRQMGVLIDDLLAFSQLSRQLVNRQKINTAKLVQNVLEELKPQLDGRRIEIKIGELPACHGDPALLKQVWVNLISNAVKYTRGREPAIIEIGCAPENNEDVYFVRDNGAGFDMQYADKLFGVFQRLHSADEFEGTGVGLAIVQRIIHRHGGRVWAEAKVNQGATFYFTIEGGNKS